MVVTSLLLLAALGDAHGKGQVTVYADDDRVTVVSPAASAGARVGPADVTVRATFDFISAASVDLVTSASPTGFEERRSEVAAGAELELGPGRTVSAGYDLSHEPDFTTHQLTLGGSIDLLERHATLALDYSLGLSSIGRVDDAVFARDRQTHAAGVTWSHVLCAEAALDLGYGLGVVRGYQANPYRYVRLFAPGEATARTALPEETPEDRVRHTATARLRARLVGDLFGTAEYRYYADTWGMQAHTATLRGALRWGEDRFTLTAEARGHAQSGASFQRERYESFPAAPRYRTADKMLGAMWTALGGLHLEWSPPVSFLPGLRFDGGADVLYLRYLDFAPQDARTALVLLIGAALDR